METNSVGESLGNKLASLNLTDDESVLLASLLGAEPDTEVEGFAKLEHEPQGFLSIEQVQMLQTKTGPAILPKGWSWGVTRPPRH